jgi:hypothetical protein
VAKSTLESLPSQEGTSKSAEMPMKSVQGLMFGALLLLMAGCGSGTGSAADSNGEGDSAGTAVDGAVGSGETMEAGGLKLTALTGSPAFPAAKLGLVNPPAGADLAAGTNRFEFSVAGFELGKPTSDQGGKGLAVNSQGQYAGLILNNGPVIQMNAAASDQALEDGHYVMLALPSRSYHESVKGGNGHILRQFNVGQPENYKELDTKAPHLFYHWPTGTLKGAGETGKVLLDFYLVNCTLAPDGYKVKLTVNGTGFVLTNWVGYVIEGLPMGESTISLELVDAGGVRVESLFNPVERVFRME